MAAEDIQAKVRAGLAKARAKAGGADSPIVYVVKKTLIKPGTPLSPAQYKRVKTPLENALFKSYSTTTISDSGGQILIGDMQLLCGPDVEIENGETIEQGKKLYTVERVESKAPFGMPFTFTAQVRPK